MGILILTSKQQGYPHQIQRMPIKELAKQFGKDVLMHKISGGERQRHGRHQGHHHHGQSHHHGHSHHYHGHSHHYHGHSHHYHGHGHYGYYRHGKATWVKHSMRFSSWQNTKIQPRLPQGSWTMPPLS